LYLWEWLWQEPFGVHLAKERVQFIEPAWKMLLSNKGLLPVLWELFPGHPNLLPAYETAEPLAGSYVRKPKLGREGSNVVWVEGGAVVEETAGDYGAEGHNRVNPRSAASAGGNEVCFPRHRGQMSVHPGWILGEGAVPLTISIHREHKHGGHSDTGSLAYPSGFVQAPRSPRKQGAICFWAFFLPISNILAQRALAAAAIRARAAGLTLLVTFRLPAGFRLGVRAGARMGVGDDAGGSSGSAGTGEAGANSMPKTAAASASLIKGAPSAAVGAWRTASAAEALLIRSAGSTPRSRKSRAGF
jgi:hypothetical protein